MSVFENETPKRPNRLGWASIAAGPTFCWAPLSTRLMWALTKSHKAHKQITLMCCAVFNEVGDS
jgi:hypothetical protein